MTRPVEATDLLIRNNADVAAGVRSATVMSRLSRGDILWVLGGLYPNAHFNDQVKHLHGEAPAELLGRYVAAVVFDLYDEGSSDEANLSRIAQALEFGVATLEGGSRALLKGSS